MTILHELNELVGSEEKNRIEMEKLQEQHRAARKTILAHQHSFGMTADHLKKNWNHSIRSLRNTMNSRQMATTCKHGK